jgi:hypothetical protein
MGPSLELTTGLAGGFGIEAAGGLPAAAGLGPVALVLLGFGVVALLSTARGNGNDDDDSTPGGGLMQPVS